ncbi:DUF4190 domain-containing protein [Actinomadura monticuli]|uniref:Septum formation family protein n=1 Tax=Actinomadura monticuli TaxID=3097367 RepID=A0ABV4QB44_9ACTN
MTTPPPTDDVPDPSEPSSPWAPPDAPAADAPAGTPAPVPALPPGPPPGVPPVPGAPPVPVPPRTNRFAVFAMVTALVGMVVLAVGFAVAALVQAARRGDEKGVGLAIGGLGVSAVWVLAAVVLFAVLPSAHLGGGRAGAGRGGAAPVTELGIGACFTGFGDDGSGGLRAKELPCAKPHEGEVVARSEAPLSARLSRAAMIQWAENLCQDKTRFLLRSRYRKDLEPYYDWSGDEFSDGKALTLTCVMRYTGSAPLTAPLAATVDTKLKTYEQLSTGDCVEEWDETDPVTATISCKRPHRFEVFASFTIPSEDFPDKEFNEYPGEKEIDKKAARGCGKRGDKVFRNRSIDRDLEVMYVMPAQEDWESGIHDVVCLVSAAHGKLKESVLP